MARGDLALQVQDVAQVGARRWCAQKGACRCAASLNLRRIRTRSPARITEPSTMPSTPSSRAISGAVFVVPVMHGGRGVRSREAHDLREFRRSALGHAVDEVVLFPIAREIDERQDCQAAWIRGARRRPALRH